MRFHSSRERSHRQAGHPRLGSSNPIALSQPQGELVRTASGPLRVALIAPPTATVPPPSLGGLDHVRRLAEGLAQRGHLVTLIGSNLGGLTGAGYALIDTDPAGGERGSTELERWHAEQAGKALEYLGGMEVDVVSDHTRSGWCPAGGVSQHLRTVHTSYHPLTSPPGPTRRRPGLLGWVAISRHQQHHASSTAWTGVIHPGIPVGGHLLSFEHTGPCVYLGPLLGSHGAGRALAAAQTAGRPIVLAGTQPGKEATAYAQAQLLPRLGRDDELLPEVSILERWELLGHASCLIAPLHPHVPYSVELVEAMTCGTPVVTLVGTVGAELVNHGVAGLIADDYAALPRAIEGAGRLDPGRVRDWASSQYDVPDMVSAYERLLYRLAATGGR